MRMEMVGLLLLCLLVTVPVYAAGAGNWIFYDNFKSGIIDPAKWVGEEQGNTGRETARLIFAQQLHLLERSYGHTGSNEGLTDAASRLNFTNSANIRGIKVTVKPLSFDAIDCDNNTSHTWVTARLFGHFFNTNPQGSDNQTSDVLAWVGVVRESTDSDTIATVKAQVSQCNNDDCTEMTELYAHELGTIKLGQQTILSMEWDKTKHLFSFTGAGKSATYAYDAHEYPANSPPSLNTKRLAAHCSVANCKSSAKPFGLVDALFDNVYIKTLSNP